MPSVPPSAATANVIQVANVTTAQSPSPDAIILGSMESEHDPWHSGLGLRIFIANAQNLLITDGIFDDIIILANTGEGKKLLGAEHPDTLTSMANLASTYRNQGRWNEADQSYLTSS